MTVESIKSHLDGKTDRHSVEGCVGAMSTAMEIIVAHGYNRLKQGHRGCFESRVQIQEIECRVAKCLGSSIEIGLTDKVEAIMLEFLDGEMVKGTQQ